MFHTLVRRVMVPLIAPVVLAKVTPRHSTTAEQAAWACAVVSTKMLPRSPPGVI